MKKEVALMLYELSPKQDIKIYCDVSDGSKYIKFDHVDGMYSYCVSEKGGILHPHCTTKVIKFKDGYKFYEEK
jgi:pyruvate/oxaloacetate carboxyltransferase